MPSPFPGMDPYIEKPSIWQDFHNNLAAEIQRQLAPQLRPRYFVRMTPRATYDTIELGKTRSALPDVGVIQQRSIREGVPGYAAIAEPPFENRVEMEVEIEQQALEIRDEDEELVTAIELLSPVNKRRGHDAFKTYRDKRRGVLRSDAHLLEIDLLRAGERVPVIDPLPDASYFVFLSRSNLRPRIGVWAIRLRDSLPTIPVPLRKPDPDVVLDLQRAVETIYVIASYDQSINYRESPPPPPLSEEDAKWLEAFLREKGLR
jgi:hypothetical protein